MSVPVYADGDEHGCTTSSSDPIVGQLVVQYDAYNKPFRTERNGNRSEFWYGSNGQRYYQLDSYGLSTVYIDKLYEQKGPGKHQLYLGNYAVFNVNITNPSETGLTYLHKDRLGSMVEMSDEQGNLITNANRGFDPFGKPREGNWTDSDHNDNTGQIGDLNRPDLTTRGFTDHEQLNNVALTHMNGRAYDYNLGRFLSVDPVISFPSNSQSLNPYTYVLNNPFSGTDPTGYTVECTSGSPFDGCQPTLPDNPEATSDMPTENGEAGGQSTQMPASADKQQGVNQRQQQPSIDGDELIELPPLTARGMAGPNLNTLLAGTVLVAFTSASDLNSDSPSPVASNLALLGLLTAVALNTDTSLEDMRGPNGVFNADEKGEEGSNAAQDLEDLTGESIEQAEEKLKKEGFNKKSRGRYDEWVHPDGSKIFVRPNGEVIRQGPSRPQSIDPHNSPNVRDRYDQNGKIIPHSPGSNSHSTGEKVER